MAKLKELYKKKPKDPDRLSKGWIFCRPDPDSQDRKKIPLLQCLSCGEAKTCAAVRSYEDIMEVLEESISKQSNPEDLKESLENLRTLLEEDSDTEKEEEEEEENDDEDENEDEKEEPEIKEVKEKKSKKKNKPDPEPEDKPEPKEDTEENKETEPEDEPNETETESEKKSIEFNLKQYLILPFIKDKGKAEKNIVSEEDVQDLINKFEDEGVEFELYKLEPVTQKRTEGVDYVIFPKEVAEPIFTPKEQLMQAASELDKNGMDFQVFELGRELRLKRKIELEYIEEES